MAPVEQDYGGYWGKPTATLDWCEANYEVTHYVAEFWNTISNLIMIVMPILGAYRCKTENLEPRFFWAHLSMAVVGVGSWCFHGTLLYHMQLLDELPMIWGSGFLLYALIEIDAKPHSENKRLQCLLAVYCIVVTVIYLIINKPIFHEAAYGLMVLTMIIYGIRIIWKYEASLWLSIGGIIIYGTGFVIWNIDNIYCPQIREFRSQVSPNLRPFLQGHAWWHLLTAIGTYFVLVFVTHARLKYLRKPCKIQMELGMVPSFRASASG